MFTYNYYELFLKRASELSSVVSLDAASTMDSYILLRHDIDFSISSAFSMFLLEKKYNITSTFFIMTTSPFYNIFSKENREILTTIVDSGFDIGLHFDPTIYGNASYDMLCDMVMDEVDSLEKSCEKSVKSISLHNPSVQHIYIYSESMNNAYSSKFFNKNTYYSDSCMNVYGKNLLDFIEIHYLDNPQILIHPFQWGQHRRTYHQIFEERLTDWRDDIDRYFSSNSAYRAECELQNEE